MAKITKDFVDRVKPAADFKTHWDEKDKGYGLRVSPLGKKVFVVMGRVKGAGKAICITIGPASMPEFRNYPPPCQCWAGVIHAKDESRGS